MELEKVIKAIECCIDKKHGCYNCEFKYTNGKVACRMFEESYNSIPTELIKNALELLKEMKKIIEDKQDIIEILEDQVSMLQESD